MASDKWVEDFILGHLLEMMDGPSEGEVASAALATTKSALNLEGAAKLAMADVALPELERTLESSAELEGAVEYDGKQPDR